MWFSVSLEGSEFRLFLHYHAEPDPPYFLFFDFISFKKLPYLFFLIVSLFDMYSGEVLDIFT